MTTPRPLNNSEIIKKFFQTENLTPLDIIMGLRVAESDDHKISSQEEIALSKKLIPLATSRSWPLHIQKGIFGEHKYRTYPLTSANRLQEEIHYDPSKESSDPIQKAHFEKLLTILFQNSRTEGDVRRVLGLISVYPKDLLSVALRLAENSKLFATAALHKKIQDELRLKAPIVDIPIPPLPTRIPYREIFGPVGNQVVFENPFQYLTAVTTYDQPLSNDVNAKISFDWLKGITDFADKVVERLTSQFPFLDLIKKYDYESSQVDERRENLVRVANGDIFFLKLNRGEDKGVKRLYVQHPNGQEEVLVDVNPKNKDAKEPISIRGFSVSPDGQRLLYTLIQGGDISKTESRLIDVKTKREIEKPLPLVDRMDCISWLPDNSGFYYVQMEATPKGEKVNPFKNQTTSLHKIGSSQDLPLVSPNTQNLFVDSSNQPIKEPIPESINAKIDIIPHSKFAVLQIRNGSDDNLMIGVKPLNQVNNPKIAWKRLTSLNDDARAYAVGPNYTLFLVTVKDAPNGKIVKYNLNDLSSPPIEVVKEDGKLLIDSHTIVTKSDGLYFTKGELGGKDLYKISYEDGAQPIKIEIPMDEKRVLIGLTPYNQGLLVSAESLTAPRRFFAVKPSTVSTPQSIQEVKLETEPKTTEAARFATKRIFAKDKNGVDLVGVMIYDPTKVQKDGNGQVWSYAYASYKHEDVMVVGYDRQALAFVEAGGIVFKAYPPGDGYRGAERYK